MLDPFFSFCALLSALPPDAARNYVVRRRPIAADAETGQISAGVGSGSYRHKSISHCLQFAFQQARRGAMLVCWTVGVDDDNFSRPFQGRAQAPENSIRFGSFMLPVYLENSAKAVCRQNRIVCRTYIHAYIVRILSRHR